MTNRILLPNKKAFEKGHLTIGESLITTMCSQWAAGDDPWPVLAKTIKPKHFVRPWEGQLWEALLGFREQGVIPGIDVLYRTCAKLAENYKEQPIREWFSNIILKCDSFTTANINYFADGLFQEWSSYTVDKIERDTAAITDIVERQKERQRRIEELQQEIGPERHRFANAKETMVEVATDWLNRVEGKHADRRLSLGYEDLGQTVVFEKGSVCYIAGRAGMGKTTFMANLIAAQKNSGLKIGIFTLEMSRLQVAQKVLAIDAMVPYDLFLNPVNVKPDQEDRIYKAFDEYASHVVNIDERGGISLDDLEEGIASMKKETGVDLVYIDHIHIMHEAVNVVPKIVGVTQISGNLKRIAKKYDVGIIAGAQMNRAADNRDDHRPRMSDLRESGSIEQDADCILMVYRDSFYETEGDEEPEKDYGIRGDRIAAEKKRDAATQVFVRKNRHGIKNNVVFRFSVDPLSLKLKPLPRE